MRSRTRLSWFLARRYLASRSGGRFLSFITWIALGGITVGVTALVVVIGVMTGMQNELREKILGSTPHIRVVPAGSSLRLDDWEGVIEKVEAVEGVVSAAPVVGTQVALVRSEYAQFLALFGVELEGDGVPVTSMEDSLRSEHLSLEREPGGLTPLVLGSGIAGRMSLFPGDTVRVVRMSNGEAFSVEVCGGTHVGATGQVGTLFVLGESGIGGGMRRIEAVTGRAAEQLFMEQASLLDSLARRLQTPVNDLETRLENFIIDTEELRRRLATLERGSLRSEAEALLGRAQDIDGVKLVSGRTSANNAEAMREMGDFIKTRLPSSVICLGAVVNGNPLLVAMVTPDLVTKGLHAGNLARDAARVMGGGGGGQPEMAQAGGRQAEKLETALGQVADLIRDALQG